MKHLFTLLAFLAVFVGSYAQGNNSPDDNGSAANSKRTSVFSAVAANDNGTTVFTGPVSGDYADGFVVNARLHINGELCSNLEGIELAAFVGDECRAVISEGFSNDFDQTNNIFMLRVWGSESDNGKEVSFKVVVDGIAYKFTNTVTYQFNGTYEPYPLDLYLDKITDISLPDEINICQEIGSTYDISKDVTYIYGGADYTPKNQSSLDTETTPLQYIWDCSDAVIGYEENSPIFTINNTTSVEGEDVYIGIQTDYGGFGSVYTLIKITVPVAKITVPESISCWKFDNLFNVLGNSITVSPEGATISQLACQVIEGETDGIGADGYCTTSGEYKVRIYYKDNENVYADINVTVKEPVSDIEASQTTVTVNVGENVYDAIKKLVTVLPENATNKELTFLVRDEEYISEKGVALKETEANSPITVLVGSAENENIQKLTFNVTITNNVTEIQVDNNEITVYVGDNVYKAIKDNIKISVLPETASNKEYTLAPNKNCEDKFPNNTATERGTYEWIVTSSQNENVSTVITVKVKDHVTLSCDALVKATIFTPSVINITVTSGAEDFDPEQLIIEYDPSIAEITKRDDGKAFDVMGTQIGKSGFFINYDGTQVCEGILEIGTELRLREGWNWISNHLYTNVPLMNESNEVLPDDPTAESDYFGGNTKIREVRSEEALLFNDDTYGVFGRISAFEGGKMYKVMVEGNEGINIPVYGDLISSVIPISHAGYSWIAYPIVGSYSMNAFTRLVAVEGDVIIGKDGFAEYTGGKWNSSSGFKLETGKGYIYYTEREDIRLDFTPGNNAEEQLSAKSFGAASNVWEYNAAAYPETMCIVAKVKGVEPSDKYSVGAFVNGECRGKGTYVTDDVMFITVAGQNGDVVSFKLYNSETEDYTDIPEMMSYTLKKGSLASPVQITATETTGINELPAADNEEGPAYNLAGQRVRSSAKGIVLRGNKKYVNR